MHISKFSYQGSPNIGLYAHATDDVCFVGTGLSNQKREQMEAVLDVPVIEVSIAGTDLIGAFMASHNGTIILPEMLSDTEKKDIEDAADTVLYLNVMLNCLGNNIIFGKNAAIAHEAYSKETVRALEKELDIEIVQRDINDVKAVGSLGVTNVGNNRMVFTNTVTEEEFSYVENILGLEATSTTVNMGSQHLHAGIICNCNGVLVGETSGGPEMTRIDEGLGFL